MDRLKRRMTKYAAVLPSRHDKSQDANPISSDSTALIAPSLDENSALRSGSFETTRTTATTQYDLGDWRPNSEMVELEPVTSSPPLASETTSTYDYTGSGHEHGYTVTLGHSGSNNASHESHTGIGSLDLGRQSSNPNMPLRPANSITSTIRKPVRGRKQFTRKPVGVSMRALPSVYRLWLWELACSAFSVACFTALAAVLLAEDGKPLEQWQDGLGEYVTINAVVSFLGTIGRSSCLVALTEIISQLKWMHFTSGARRLGDLEVFDEASRGPLGALKLLVFNNWRTILASYASLLVLASLAMDPFVQLIINTPPKLVDVANNKTLHRTAPEITTTSTYEPFPLVKLDKEDEFCVEPGTYNINTDQSDTILQAAIASTLWNDALPPSMPCIYEECEWPNITTLGACSTCRDIKEDINVRCAMVKLKPPIIGIDCNYTISMNNEERTIGAKFTTIPKNDSFKFDAHTLWNSVAIMPTNILQTQNKGTPADIIDFAFVSFDQGAILRNIIQQNSSTGKFQLMDNPPFKDAMHCSISFCERSFTNIHSVSTNASMNSSTKRPLKIDTWNDSSKVLRLDTVDDLPPNDPQYSINNCHWYSLSYYLEQLLTADFAAFGNEGYGKNNAASVGRALARVANITAHMEALADSMTEVIRTSNGSTPVIGTGKNTVTFIAIRWKWLALPASVVFFSFVTLLFVILQNRRRGVPVWRSSSLALLFHTLEGWDDPYRLDGDGPRKVKEKARDMVAVAGESGGVSVFSNANASGGLGHGA